MQETKGRILLAEDDANLSSLLKEYLGIKGFEVTLTRDGDQAWEYFETGKFDLCLLDVMMPKQDGFNLARQIRKTDAMVPIIFLTAKSMKEDKMEGFEIGADDYITKPFSVEELMARITAVLRRTRQKDDDLQEVYNLGSMEFNTTNHLLTGNDVKVKLTTKEAELLKLLCVKRNQVLEREVALKKIWGNDTYFTARSMDVFITKLRKYLKSEEDVQIINIHGTGYKLISEAAKV